VRENQRHDNSAGDVCRRSALCVMLAVMLLVHQQLFSVI
jgi:hypothetical protein